MGRQRARKESLLTLRERAFNDYMFHPKMGSARKTISQLLKVYQEEAKEHGPGAVPTLSRNDLYRWAREDEWDKRAAELNTEQIESERRNYEQIRKQRMDDLSDLSVHAIEKVRWVLTTDNDKVTPTHLLRAAELVLDRMGLTSRNAFSIGKDDGDGLPDEPEDVVEKDLNLLYHELVKNRK